MNFNTINKKALNPKQSSQIYILSENNPQKNKLSNRQKKPYISTKNNKKDNDKPVNTYYYKDKEDNKENHDANKPEDMAEFINRMQNKKGDKIFGSYKKSHYLNNQYSIERYYKYNKIVNRIMKEDEQIMKQNKLYSSPLQNLDSSESDSIIKKQKHKTHARNHSPSPNRKRKDRKNVEESKQVVATPSSTPKYNNLNHNNTIFNQTTIQYNNDTKSNYISPPMSPVNANYDNNYNNNNNIKNNNKLLTDNVKKGGNEENQNNNKKMKKNKELVNNKNKVIKEKPNERRDKNNDRRMDNFSSSPNRNYGKNYYSSSPITCPSPSPRQKYDKINKYSPNIYNNSYNNKNNIHGKVLDNDKNKRYNYQLDNNNDYYKNPNENYLTPNYSESKNIKNNRINDNNNNKNEFINDQFNDYNKINKNNEVKNDKINKNKNKDKIKDKNNEKIKDKNKIKSNKNKYNNYINNYNNDSKNNDNYNIKNVNNKNEKDDMNYQFENKPERKNNKSKNNKTNNYINDINDKNKKSIKIRNKYNNTNYNNQNQRYQNPNESFSNSLISNISLCSSISSMNSSYLYPVNPYYHLPTTSVTPAISFSSSYNINHEELENNTKEILRKEEMKMKAYKNSRSNILNHQPTSVNTKVGLNNKIHDNDNNNGNNNKNNQLLDDNKKTKNTDNNNNNNDNHPIIDPNVVNDQHKNEV